MRSTHTDTFASAARFSAEDFLADIAQDLTPETDTGLNAFGFDMKAQQLQASGLISGVASHGSQTDKRKMAAARDKQMEQLRQLANSSSIISQEQFSKMQADAKEKVDFFAEKLADTNQQIEIITVEIDGVTVELTEAEIVQHQTARDLFRAADAQSMANYNAEITAGTLAAATTAYAIAQEKGDVEAATKAAHQQYASSRMNGDDLVAVEETSALTDIARDSHDQALEATKGLETRLDDLIETRDDLEVDAAAYDVQLQKYTDFQDYLETPEAQQKLADGTLDIETLERNGAPADVIAKLKENSPTPTVQYGTDDIIGATHTALDGLKELVANPRTGLSAAQSGIETGTASLNSTFGSAVIEKITPDMPTIATPAFVPTPAPGLALTNG